MSKLLQVGLEVPLPNGTSVKWYREMLPGEIHTFYNGALVVAHPERPPTLCSPRLDGSILVTEIKIG